MPDLCLSFRLRLCYSTFTKLLTMTQPFDFWVYREQQLRALGSLPEPTQAPINAPAEISVQRIPVGYSASDLKSKTLQHQQASATRARTPKLHVGERGGRYYKRTRADGTTYRDYTY
jgi:hypothetical protein